MQTLRKLYRIGRGPSSSHTIGPERACLLLMSENPTADRFRAVLYGSLAKTGVGHGTDRVIKSTLKNVEIVFDENTDMPHPNTLDLTAFEGEKELAFMRVYSVGGGAIRVEDRHHVRDEEIYQEKNFAEIKAWCQERNARISDYVFAYEGDSMREYLREVWEKMQASIDEGLKATGVLPGGLRVERKARVLFEQEVLGERENTRENRLVCAYAFAVSEQNAATGTIVTAPTCGACGVLPAVLRYLSETEERTEEEIIRALATAGIIGNVIKANASISGAECGCQAEIGSACSMAAAAIGELHGRSLDEIEYAAEVAMEHHLGLTCDPIRGLVQIPCIERNAVAAMRAINAENLAGFLSHSRKISFDLVVQTMYETGKDLARSYRETAEGGLAKLYK